jgi:ribosomal protein S19E (S16A)
MSNTYDSVFAGVPFTLGDTVEKFTGDYQLKGVVRSVFVTSKGNIRVVVEHDPGFLHIYAPNNLRLVKTPDPSVVKNAHKEPRLDTFVVDVLRTLNMGEMAPKYYLDMNRISATVTSLRILKDLGLVSQNGDDFRITENGERYLNDLSSPGVLMMFDLDCLQMLSDYMNKKTTDRPSIPEKTLSNLRYRGFIDSDRLVTSRGSAYLIMNADYLSKKD